MRQILTAFLLFLAGVTIAQEGYQIAVDVDDYPGEEAFLGYYLGGKQYVLDTVEYSNGQFVFEGDEPLAQGFYLVVFPPDNIFFQLLISDDDQMITVEVDTSEMQIPMRVTGSEDSEIFYDYARFISDRRKEAEELKAKIEAQENEGKKDKLRAKLEVVDNAVKNRQSEIINKYPESLTAMLIMANNEVEIPTFSGTEEEKNVKVYNWYRAHFFDNLDLSDPRIARTPFAPDKITYYLDNLTFQKPDSINQSLDYILSHMDTEGESFQVFLAQFLNKYAGSKIVGMDAVYVHLVDNYYAQGLAPWTEEEQLAKIIKNANTLKPILIGEIAPDLKLQDRNKQPITVHGVDAKFTVLFFWDPECGHCKKSIPKLIDFYNEYSKKGVEILAVCTKLQDGEKECWKAVDEKGMDIWLNASDAYLRSRFKQIYDVRTTPQIFILNDEKEIVMKKIGAEQLPDVLDHLLDLESG